MNADGTPDDGAQDDINNANNDQEQLDDDDQPVQIESSIAAFLENGQGDDMIGMSFVQPEQFGNPFTNANLDD